MRSILKLLVIVVIVTMPILSHANEHAAHIVKKPEGLRKSDPNKDPELTIRDRQLWRSVLRWCDECEKRSKPSPEFFDENHGRIYTYPLSKTQYIVDVECAGGMQQSEHLYYKVTEHADKIESRLLPLEQFYFIVNTDSSDDGDVDPTKERVQKGEFIRFTDPLIYGMTQVDQKKKQLIVEKRYRGMGGCGLLTVYDVRGDSPKVAVFRGKTYCSANYVPPREWKLYPAKQRARWRIAPNPLREDWKNKNQCR